MTNFLVLNLNKPASYLARIDSAQKHLSLAQFWLQIKNTNHQICNAILSSNLDDNECLKHQGRTTCLAFGCLVFGTNCLALSNTLLKKHIPLALSFFHVFPLRFFWQVLSILNLHFLSKKKSIHLSYDSFGFFENSLNQHFFQKNVFTYKIFMEVEA